MKAAALLAWFIPSIAYATVPDGYAETKIADGLARVAGIAAAPDGRIFAIEEYTGKIKIIKNGQVLEFATVAPVYTGHNETGLVGIALDPKFAKNGYVYVFHTATESEQRVVRYTAVGDAGTDATLLIQNLPTNGINHNGGGLGFGPDGKLYVSVGDNGTDAPMSQSTTSLKGKLLRYNPDGTIPNDNPYGANNPIWCIGLRNTFRFAFNPDNGKCFGAENGPTDNDEINIYEKGKNYGWPIVSGVSDNPKFVNPILTYTPTIAPTGIAFYTNDLMPAFKGNFFFCDYKNGILRRVVLHLGQHVLSVSEFVTGHLNMTDVAMGPDGAIYFSRLSGTVWRVTPSGTNSAPFASFFYSSSSADPKTVHFDASGSNDADGSVVAYAWDFGDSGTGSGVTVDHTYAANGSYTVKLTVTDNLGAKGITSNTIAVGQATMEHPSAHIETVDPDHGSAPLKVHFEGHGHDEDGTIVSLAWDLGDGTTSNQGEFDHTYTTAGTYTVKLTVTDNHGASDTATVTITVAHP